MTIRLFFCLIFSVYVQASNAESISTLQTLSFAARSSLCETLLQSDKQLAAIPLNSSAVVELLDQLGMVHFLDTADSRLASLTSPRTQEYIRQ
jgi:hypothetical protein